MDGTSGDYSFFSNLPDQMGYLVISKGAVIKSDGDLANQESLAVVVQKMVHIGGAKKVLMDESYEQLVITYRDHFYVIVKSGNAIYVVKRKVQQAGSSPTS
ncbi:hypothetical protein AB6A40_000892 [Gnathostoma spinigerum]|uniref:Late endosomal/lysosomal adaptor and MAPK and MTOR activator 4 n=1 Tax=Gnathostoma spinigerum TaxID=75299 RepID=A0ABD6E2Z4_9BILA